MSATLATGWLAAAEQSLWFPGSICKAGFFLFVFYYYFFLSFPENVISACFFQSTGVLCSLQWGSGPLKRTDKWQAQRHQCVCGPEWGPLSLDHVREQGVATLHVDHSKNLLHREKHKVKHSFHCCHTVWFKTSSLRDMSSGSEDSVAMNKMRSRHLCSLHLAEINDLPIYPNIYLCIYLSMVEVL